jgi:glycosyltransferase involved in cell wall biosynthesis
MPPHGPKPRLIVVSSFLDKRHGTERCVAEQLERLGDAYEIHLYSERVEGVDMSKIILHRVRIPPGPHLFRYVWWLLANHVCRWIDRHLRGLVPDVVYSPGVNCFDADVISVHVVFGRLRQQKREGLQLRRNPLKLWALVLHRRMYYWLCEFLEGYVYEDKRVTLVAVSKRTAQDLTLCSRRKENIEVVYYGIDSVRFNPRRRKEMRPSSRATLGIPDDVFAILLIGNDWKLKGLPCLLDAAVRLRNPRFRILVAGHDAVAPYHESIRHLGIARQVVFLPVRADVEFYYAAADVYAGPSIEDAFALPPAEAMGCGLPTITTRMAGVSEIITHGVNGLILEDPADSLTLSKWLEQLATDPDWRNRMGQEAILTVAQYTWERNASQMHQVIDHARRTLRRG